MGGGLLLRHDRAQTQELKLEAKGVAAVRGSPRDPFLKAPMSRTKDLAWRIVQAEAEATGGNVAPGAPVPGRRASATLAQWAAAHALGTAGAVLVRFDKEMKDSLGRAQVMPDDLKVVETQEIAE